MTKLPLDLLRCPACTGSLREGGAELECTACERRYALRDDVPDMLLEPSLETHEGSHGILPRVLHSVVAAPAVYDLVQRLAGREGVYRRLRDALGDSERGLVLDVGAGTGTLEGALPASARYLWLDSDPQKLNGFRMKSSSPAVLADATRIPFRDDSVEWAVSVGVSHHLDDRELGLMLGELRRVVSDRIVFLDAVASPALTSRMLWRYDRGAHPRTTDALRRQLAEEFDLVTADEFSVRHRYLLVSGRPRSD